MHTVLAKKLLLEWHKSTYYHNAAEEKITKELLESGRYLIVDNFFYPWNAHHVWNFSLQKGTPSSSRALLENNADIPLGVSFAGEIFVSMSSENGIFVFDQTGALLKVIDDSKISLWKSNARFDINSPDSNSLSPTFYAIHPNGDFYSLYAIKDEVACIYKATRTWGVDYIALARDGLSSEGDELLANKLKSMTTKELRIIRNALMALHGYAFQSKELSDYFLGYDWYAPDQAVKNEASILSAAQKRLFDLVISIEKERVIAP